MPPSADQKKRAAAVRKRLTRAMPKPETELRFDDPWQLLVVTILSAQSTDKTVNRIAPDLFARYPDPQALGAAPLSTVERLIKPSGFFHNKAKAIVGASRQLVERHDGQVPKSMEALCELPGVARKTANVVLGTAYGIASGITVDTHAGRVARRLELTAETDPTKVERDLCALLPTRSWVDMGHRLVLHGRYVCQSRRPQCGPCPLNELCPAAADKPVGRWTQRADQEGVVVLNQGGASP